MSGISFVIHFVSFVPFSVYFLLLMSSRYFLPLSPPSMTPSSVTLGSELTGYTIDCFALTDHGLDHIAGDN